MGSCRRLAIVSAAIAWLIASEARAWLVRMDGNGPGGGAANAVATRGDGDVIASGVLDTGFQGDKLVVVRLDGSTGAERWRSLIVDGAASIVPEAVTLLAVDSAGDVVMTVRHVGVQPAAFSTVYKIAGDSGHVDWFRTVHEPNALRTDAANDVYVATRSLGVVKLSATTGEPVWTFEQTGGATDLAILMSQDPVVVGSVPAALPLGTGGVVIRLDRATGVPVWTQPLTAEQGLPNHVVTSGDDVFVGSELPLGYGSAQSHFALALSATTGEPHWSRDLGSLTSVDGLAVTSTGNLALAGAESQPAADPVPTMLRALVLARTDGAILMQGVVPPHVPPIDSCQVCSAAVSTALVADTTGDLSIVGSFRLSDVVAARLQAPDLKVGWRLDGGDFPVVPGHFLPRAAVGGASGALVVAGARRASAELNPGTVREFAVLSIDATGALRVCGDDVRDPGEACDDGNQEAGDCCAADCSSAAPTGSACSDGSFCTLDDRCGADGRCQGGPPPPCAPCGECHSATGCFIEPQDACGQSTVTNGARLEIAAPRRGPDHFAWSLRSGPATAKSEFGDPLDATGYAVCGSLPDGRVVLRASAPGGGCTSRRRCWRSTRNGFEYADPSAPDGMTRLSLRAGGAGRTRIRAAGAKDRVLIAPLPIDEELRVELRRLDDPGVCWASTLSTVTKNSARKFRAKGR